MGTHLNRLAEAVLTSIHNPCFEQTYENYQNFISENFPFSVVKFSVHLNRLVFVKGEYIKTHLIVLIICYCIVDKASVVMIKE